jgi:CHAT domain-containing protein
MPITSGRAELAFAGKEMMVLNDLLPASTPRVTLRDPHKNEVLTTLDRCSIFDFAGHSVSHPSDPSMNTLLLADWQTNPLTVNYLVAMKFHQNPPLLAYLSASSTGNNKEFKLLDEGIHLMGACQPAGFRHVIGALWEVPEMQRVDVAKDVYETMINAGISDKFVSLGLHNAVMNLRRGCSPAGTTRAATDAHLIETEES